MQQLWIVTRCLMKLITVGILFSMCSLELEECRIRNRDLAALAVSCAGEGICACAPGIPLLILGMVPAILMLAVCALSHGQLGIGDVWLFWALGLRLEPTDTYLLAQTAFLLAGICGLQGRRKTMPLVPCVALVLSVQTAADILSSAGEMGVL